MVRLNKPIKLLKESDDSESIDNGDVVDTVIDESLSQEEEKVKQELLNKRVDKILSVFTVFLLALVSGVFIYMIIYFNYDSTPAYLLSERAYIPKKEKIHSEKEIYAFDEGVDTPNFEEVSSEVVYAFNPVTHQVYFDSNIDQSVQIASITKLLSALVAIEQHELNDQLVVGDLSDLDTSWVLGLQEGDVILFEDALKAMLINSYNDAAFVVADNHPGGQEAFVEAMNSKAKLLGMSSSSFQNPAGLDDENNFSTARDLKRLVHLILKEDVIMDMVKESESSVRVYQPEQAKKGEELNLNGVAFRDVKLESTNELLNEDHYIAGLKTGYTREAGPSFIGFFKSTEADQLVTIVLNAKGDRFEETADLVNVIRSYYPPQ